MNIEHSRVSVDPATLVGDAWMHDPEHNAEFQRCLAAMDKDTQPLVDAIKASERLTTNDLALIVY
mgnify:CR=1 FL=1